MISLSPSYQFFRENPKPYYSKSKVQKTIKRSDTWVRKWSDILISEIELEDFAFHFKAHSGLNFHQACVLSIISDWKRECPSMCDSQLKDLILENLDSLTIEAILEDTSKDYEETENHIQLAA